MEKKDKLEEIWQKMMRTEMKQVKWQGVVIACTGIAGITTLICVAMQHGIDGVALAGGMTAIGGIVAGALGYWRGKAKKE